jgi:superfamily II DNA helicase RecQ
MVPKRAAVGGDGRKGCIGVVFEGDVTTERGGQVPRGRRRFKERNVRIADRMVWPNITYAAVGYERKEVDEAVRWLVEENSHRHLEPGQVVIYCRKVEWAKRSAAVLGCSVHHRAVGEQQEKKGVLRMLARQAEQGFTATNALGVGIST